MIAYGIEAYAHCRAVDGIVECSVSRRADIYWSLAESLELGETQPSTVPLYIEEAIFGTMAYPIPACDISETFGIGAIVRGYIMRVSVGVTRNRIRGSFPYITCASPGLVSVEKRGTFLYLLKRFPNSVPSVQCQSHQAVFGLLLQLNFLFLFLCILTFDF